MNMHTNYCVFERMKSCLREMILCYVIVFERFEINEFGLPFEIVKYSTKLLESQECVMREK